MAAVAAAAQPVTNSLIDTVIVFEEYAPGLPYQVLLPPIANALTRAEMIAVKSSTERHPLSDTRSHARPLGARDAPLTNPLRPLQASPGVRILL